MPTNTMRDVWMEFPDADPDMNPRVMRRGVLDRLALFAAGQGYSLVSAPELSWASGTLTATAHARPAMAQHRPVPACAAHGEPDLWTSDEKADQAEAVSVCRTLCPLVDSCLAGALARKERSGVFGGTVFPLSRKHLATIAH